MIIRVELYLLCIYIPLLISAGRQIAQERQLWNKKQFHALSWRKFEKGYLVEIYKNQTFVRKLYLIKKGMITQIGIIIGA